MGFGFNLLFIFIIVPLTALLLLGWLLTRKKIYGKIIPGIWIAIFGLILISLMIQTFTKKKKLKKDDYYGKYIINRDYFAGKQADWQYDTFRFEIKENDSLYFYITDKEKVLKIFRGTIKTTDPSQFSSERLIINMDSTNHVMASNPTIYRSAWSFYLVFYSPKFNNVYFKKGKWRPIGKLQED